MSQTSPKYYKQERTSQNLNNLKNSQQKIKELLVYFNKTKKTSCQNNDENSFKAIDDENSFKAIVLWSGCYFKGKSKEIKCLLIKKFAMPKINYTVLCKSLHHFKLL